MTSYFEDLRSPQEMDNRCMLCKWMSVVKAHEEPCKYCDNYGCEEEPEDFDYEKLKRLKLCY